MNYEEDIKIDENALEVEWLGQAELSLKYGQYLSECKKRLMIAEEHIKVVRAQLIKEANENPDEVLGEGVKPTGPNVESYYRNHDKHKKAKQEWIDLTYECNMAEVAKNEIGFTRKTALENLVRLYGQNYFAGPTVPRDISEEVQRKHRENIGEKKQKNSNSKVKFKRKNS